MKKILTLALALVSSIAFAQEGPSAPVSTTVSQVACPAGSVTCTQAANASTAGATNAGVQLTQTNNGADMKNAGADAAKIQADAAIEVAKIQANTGTRDAAADKNAALDRQAAIDIATINAHPTIKNTPSVSGPPLVSSNDTCMGSASGAFNAPGIGIALGKTYTDENCTMLKNSRELWNMGMKAASLALMCNDTNNRSALELTGFECPQTEKAKREAMLASPTVRYTDPIVRARLNLPPL